MAIVNIGDLLDRASQFEEKLEHYYADIRDQTQHDGTRLLTYYLARHRRHLAMGMAHLEATAVKRIRSIKLKYDVEFHPEQAFLLMDTAPSRVKPEALLDAAVAHDQLLIDLYKGVLEQPLSDEGRVLFESLVRMEEKDIVMIKKMIAMNYF